VFRADGLEGIAGAAVPDVVGIVGAEGVLVLDDVGGAEGEVIDAAVMPARSQGFGGEACAMILEGCNGLVLWALSHDEVYKVWRGCVRSEVCRLKARNSWNRVELVKRLEGLDEGGVDNLRLGFSGELSGRKIGMRRSETDTGCWG